MYTLHHVHCIHCCMCKLVICGLIMNGSFGFRYSSHALRLFLIFFSLPICTTTSKYIESNLITCDIALPSGATTRFDPPLCFSSSKALFNFKKLCFHLYRHHNSSHDCTPSSHRYFSSFRSHYSVIAINEKKKKSCCVEQRNFEINQ